MRRIPISTLVEFGTQVLTAKGLPQASASHIAQVIVETEAFGVTTHGLVQLSHLEGQLGDEIDPQAEPLVVKEHAASVLIDGNRACGQLAMKLAREIAATKAWAGGVAMAAVRNSYWIGALGVYLVPLAREGLFAQLWAQTSTCKDCAPVGGIDARFSTNPVALAFPTGGDPMLADFSTAAVAMGKVGRMVRLGEKAEEPIFRDARGNLTNDPAVVRKDGSILFLGGTLLGHKGYALSLWCEALTAMAGGSANNPEAPTRQSFNLTVIEPAAFGGREYYDQEMRRFIAHVKSSRRLPGVEAIRLPGERGFQALRQAQRDGVPVDDAMLNTLLRLAKKHGLEGLLTSEKSPRRP
jgi:LDH2 family malate/lactate/ureidoglycolate dehydrogenase